MAVCEYCKKDMSDEATKSCSCNKQEMPNGKVVDRVPYDDYNSPGCRCHDCNVANGGFHHPGCDMERCPICGGQLIGCNCHSNSE